MTSTRVLGPILAVVLAVGGALVLTRDREITAQVDVPSEPVPVAVTSNAPRVGTLPELVASADLVVRGSVTGIDRGRMFGEPGAGAVESRLVTIRVDEVLAGEPPPEAAVVVEEEGWLDDGTPIVVDGLAPSELGDDGIWFLVDVGTDELPVHVVVSAQGRYLVDDGALIGAEGNDPLVADLAARTPTDLVAAITALPTAPG